PSLKPPADRPAAFRFRLPAMARSSRASPSTPRINRKRRGFPMPSFLVKPCTAFEGDRFLAAGPLVAVVLAVKLAEARTEATQAIAIFDDTTGLAIDFDRRGSEAEVVTRLARLRGFAHGNADFEIV